MSGQGRRLNHRQWHTMRHRLAAHGLGWRCSYCAQPITCGRCVPETPPDTVATIDHIIPIRDGGPSMIGNLALSCVRCQNEKDNPKGAKPELAEGVA